MNLQLIDTEKVLDFYNIDFLKSGKNISSGWWGLKCPFCYDDPSTHLGIFPERNIISCWRCSKKGNIFDLIVAITGKSYRKIKHEIAEFILEDISIKFENSNLQEIEIPKEFSHIMNKNSYNYLKKRGFNPYYIWNKYELMNPNPEFIGKYNFRIIIPFFYKNKMVTFTARDYTESSNLRYYALESFNSVIPIGQCIYNIDNLEENKEIFLFEGTFDVWKFEDNACALYGVQYNSSKIAKLILDKRPKKVYIILDPGAETSAEKLAVELSVYTKVEIIFLNGDKDIGDFTYKDVEKLKKELGYEYF